MHLQNYLMRAGGSSVAATWRFWLCGRLQEGDKMRLCSAHSTQKQKKAKRENDLHLGFLIFFVSFTPCQIKKKKFTPIWWRSTNFFVFCGDFKKKGLQSEEPPNFTIIKEISKNKKTNKQKGLQAENHDFLRVFHKFFHISGAVLFLGNENVAKLQFSATLSLF